MNIMIKIRTCIQRNSSVQHWKKARKLPPYKILWCVPPSRLPLHRRMITQLVISRSLTPPGPTVLVRFVSRTRVLARLSSPSIAPANRAIRTDRSAIHVERRGSAVAAQCSRIIYADDVETIPCTNVPLHAHTHVQYRPKVRPHFFFPIFRLISC